MSKKNGHAFERLWYKHTSPSTTLPCQQTYSPKCAVKTCEGMNPVCDCMIQWVDEFLRCPCQAEKTIPNKVEQEKHLKEKYTVRVNKITEWLKVKYVSSLVFYQSSDAPESLVFAFHFQNFDFVAFKPALICANIYLIPTVNCETRSTCKAVKMELLLSRDAITSANMDSASHSMWKICQRNIVKC